MGACFCYFCSVPAILTSPHLTPPHLTSPHQSTDTGINIQHLVHTDQGTFRMKRRRWEPTKIGVANQLPQQRSSSRSSSRSTSREGRPGEQSQLFLSTAPKARQVLSRAEGVVEVRWPEADEAASDLQEEFLQQDCLKGPSLEGI